MEKKQKTYFVHTSLLRTRYIVPHSMQHIFMLDWNAVYQVPVRTHQHLRMILSLTMYQCHRYTSFFFESFSSSLLLSSPFYSLSLLVVTQIRGHIAGSSPPLPTTVRALHFFREKTSALSSLVDSRRIVPTHATVSALRG